MNSICNSRLPRWPAWAGGGDFRRRAGSALTHPVTVVALGVLLLNDLLFKALWPHAWATGKLSDLAWVVFALPLLAFLLSFVARGGVTAQRLAFVVAYAGLPLLYAAFNTFEPVHDWIMRGISLAGGAAGSPRDATDSLVIPLAWGAALWVCRREPAAQGAMRLRWAVLVVCCTSFAIGSQSCESEPLQGVTRVGLNDDGVVFAQADYETYYSLDGGLSWILVEHQLGGIAWGGQSADTPRDRFTIEGPRVVRVGADSSSERVVYSTEYLEQDGNAWVQKVSTEKLGGPREIASRPLAIVFDERNGNLVLALGIQGVLVGTPDGEWASVSVGSFEATDFSFLAKTGLLLSDTKFWTAALALAVSMTGAALVAFQHRIEDLVRAVALAVVAAVGASILAAILAAVLFYLLPSIIVILALPIALIAVALGISSMPRHSTVRKVALVGMGAISVVASAALISLFGFSNDALGNDEIRFNAIAVVASLFALSLFVASRRQLFRHWRLAAASFSGATALVVLAFMLWLHLGADEALTKFCAIALPGTGAVLIARHLAQKEGAESVTCPECGVRTPGYDGQCTNCGALLSDDEETWVKHSETIGPDGVRLGGASFRMLAGILDILVLHIVAAIAFRIAWHIGLGFYSLLSSQEIVLFFLAFSLVYNPILVGVFSTTPGKRLFGLRVLRTDGSRVGFRRAVVREVGKIGPMLLVNAVVMAIRADRRGLHDLLADTVVVRRKGESPSP